MLVHLTVVAHSRLEIVIPVVVLVSCEVVKLEVTEREVDCCLTMMLMVVVLFVDCCHHVVLFVYVCHHVVLCVYV